VSPDGETNVIKQFASLYDLFEAFPDEQSCIDHLRSIRWANGAFCPHCGSTKVYDFSDKRTHKCGDCRQRFSIKVGTIFEDTKLPLRKWFAAIWLITSNRKGIASTQLARDLKITQKSAWFVLHRLRHAARTDSFNGPLSGEVGVDETAVGGLEKNKHAKDRKHAGRGAVGKTIVMGIVQKGGEVRAGVIDDVDGSTLKEIIRAHVSPGSVVVTDQWAGYIGLTKTYDHKTVNHTLGEYVSDGHTTNGVESFWALFKRQYHGTHHWISPKHMDAYIGEMSYRQNHRELGEGERVNDLLSQVDGRLTYKTLIA
jgi:transposase-like protein